MDINVCWGYIVGDNNMRKRYSAVIEAYYVFFQNMVPHDGTYGKDCIKLCGVLHSEFRISFYFKKYVYFE